MFRDKRIAPLESLREPETTADSLGSPLRALRNSFNEYTGTDEDEDAGEEGEGGESKLESQCEEIKLSHETDEANANSVEELSTAFTRLNQQIAEFKRRAEQATVRLKEVELSRTELEEKVDTLEEENSELKENLSAAAQGGGVGGNFLILGGRGGGGGGGGDGKMAKSGANIRQALQNSSAESGEEMDLGISDYDVKASLFLRFKNWYIRNKPFQREFRQIQARFGASVTSYFVFYRFLFLQFSLIGAVSLSFAVVHLVYLCLHGTPSINSLLINTHGLLPAFMLYSSYHTVEAFHYSLMVVIGILVFIYTIIEHLVNEDRTMKQVDAVEKGNETPYCKDVLCCWDMSLATHAESSEYSNTLGNMFSQKVEETRTQGKKNARSNYDLFVLYSKRFLGFTLYAGVQAGSFAAIIFLTINSEALTQMIKATPLANFSSVIAPLALNIINTIMPPLLKLITAFEAWDSGTMYLNILLFRMYASNTLNTLILALSYILLADPFLIASYPSIRGQLELKETGLFNCRIDQCADALFTLFVTGFVSSKIGIVSSWILKRIATVKKPFVKTEFEIAPTMIALLNFVSLVLLTFPFAPLSLLLFPFMIWINIKAECYAMLEFSAKPLKPWKAHQSGVIFTFFYLATLMLVGLPAAVYFLTTKTFPKDCMLQDNFVGLCSTSVSKTKLTCATSRNSDYYTTFGRISGGYPNAICANACGAFVQSSSNFQVQI